MSRVKDTDILIIGSGFAGTSVASMLPADRYMIIDRGEPFDLAAANAALNVREMPLMPGHLASRPDAVTRVYRSTVEGNQIRLPLSFMTVNGYSYMQGGNSNCWGANAARVTPDTFRRDGVLAWPIGYDELEPYYRQAEQLLRVHGDPTVEDYTVFGPMPGWQYWRDYLKDIFPRARMNPAATNMSDSESPSLGLCHGNGHCVLCGNDAKPRPTNIFPMLDVVGRSYVQEILFDGTRAVAVRGSSDGEDFEIKFERLVLAAGGLENAALLKRSHLPDGVSQMVGRRYQDHTCAVALVLMPRPFEKNNVGGLTYIEVPELSGYFHDIGVKALMQVTAPELHEATGLAHNYYRCATDYLNARHDAERLACFYLQIEVPPEWDLELRSNGRQSYIYTLPYLKKVPSLDRVVLDVLAKMTARGLRVLQVYPYYRSAFGGYHFSGTTSMSRTDGRVVSPEQLLIGTDNVYINGASVLPRCGESGPTLSIVALGLRLGENLAGL